MSGLETEIVLALELLFFCLSRRGVVGRCCSPAEEIVLVFVAFMAKTRPSC